MSMKFNNIELYVPGGRRAISINKTAEVKDEKLIIDGKNAFDINLNDYDDIMVVDGCGLPEVAIVNEGNGTLAVVLDETVVSSMLVFILTGKLLTFLRNKVA